MLQRRGLCAAIRERLFVPWLRLVIGSIFLLWGSPALAHTVALLRPPVHSAGTTELLQRLRGELLSLGFEVTVREREPSKADPQLWQSLLAAEGEIDAAVDLIGDAAPFAVDVWIADGAHQFQLVTRVTLDTNSDNPSKRLAIRASEVLRARLLETRAGTSERNASDPPRPPVAPPVEAPAPTSQRSRSLGFELGAAALTSLDGVGPAFLPLVAFDWAIESELLLQATFAGFGTQPSVEAPEGSAQVALQYGLLGALYRFDWNPRVRPFGGLSLGALRSAVVGQADLPRAGHSVDQWSFLVDASLGAALQFSQQYGVLLAGHVQLAEPYVAIHFGEREVASLGRPNLLLTLTFGVWP